MQDFTALASLFHSQPMNISAHPSNYTHLETNIKQY